MERVELVPDSNQGNSEGSVVVETDETPVVEGLTSGFVDVDPPKPFRYDRGVPIYGLDYGPEHDDD